MDNNAWDIHIDVLVIFTMSYDLCILIDVAIFSIQRLPFLAFSG